MQLQDKIEASGFSPSFSCYSSDSRTSTAVAKAIREEEVARFHENEDVGYDDFEFSSVLSNEQVSVKGIDSRFPVFNRYLLVNDDVNREIIAKDDGVEASSAITDSLENFLLDKREESNSCSSSEAEELESLPSGTYCVWKSKADGASSPLVTKCKRSSSTGSGSKRWRFRNFLRRSNSEGDEPKVLLTPKKVENPKQKRNSGEVSDLRRKAHDEFYMQRRAENEVGRRKSYLPYRKDLVGLFANVNGMGKLLPF